MDRQGREVSHFSPPPHACCAARPITISSIIFRSDLSSFSITLNGAVVHESDSWMLSHLVWPSMHSLEIPQIIPPRPRIKRDLEGKAANRQRKKCPAPLMMLFTRWSHLPSGHEKLQALIYNHQVSIKGNRTLFTRSIGNQTQASQDPTCSIHIFYVSMQYIQPPDPWKYIVLKMSK